MKETRVDLDGALDWVITTYEQVLSSFEEQRGELPSWGPAIDSEVKHYMDRMSWSGHCVICSFICVRQAERAIDCKG
jgi:hypothetical protein